MEKERLEIDQLRQALVTRTVIGQATGILCGRLQVSTELAWEIMRRASTDSNVKLRRVAEVIVKRHDGSRDPADDAIAARIAPVLGYLP